MVILYQPSFTGNLIPATFGAGLAPIQADNTLPRMPYSSADLADYEAGRLFAPADELARMDDARIELFRLAELEELAEAFGRGPVNDRDMIPAGGWA